MKLSSKIIFLASVCSIGALSSIASQIPNETIPQHSENTMQNDQLYLSYDREIFGLKRPNLVEPKFKIKNLSVVNWSFSSSTLNPLDSLEANAIRAALSLNKAKNHLCVNHSDLFFMADPKDLYEEINRRMAEHQISEKSGNDMLTEIKKTYPEYINSDSTRAKIYKGFLFKSNGNTREYLNGICPSAVVEVFENRVKSFKGNVHYRELIQDIPVDVSFNLISEFIGTPCQRGTLEEVANSVKGENKNESAGITCGGLVTVILRKLGIFDKPINASNVVPSMLVSKAGQYDVLSGKAGKDIPLKLDFTFTDKDIEGKNCLGTIGREFISSGAFVKSVSKDSNYLRVIKDMIISRGFSFK